MTIPNNNRGVIAAIGAYAYWGLVPLYWKLVTSIQADELLYSRLVLTALTCLLLLPLRGTFPVFRAAWTDTGMLKQRLFSAALLAGNWYSFMWAVNNDRVIESSLGYFLCPLVSVFLGLRGRHCAHCRNCHCLHLVRVWLYQETNLPGAVGGAVP
jgi:chloramphenicol-sensitive protein RarD